MCNISVAACFKYISVVSLGNGMVLGNHSTVELCLTPAVVGIKHL